MKQIILSTLAILLIFACQAPEQWPEDIAGKKALLKEKRTELQILQSDIDKLNEELETLEPKKIDKAVVDIDTVKATNFKSYVSVQANVVSDDMAMASSETGGRILSVNVEEGQYVKRGGLIARVDLQSLEKQKDELVTSLNFATTVFERQKRLWDQEIGSELQYLEAKTNKERIEKGIAQIETQLAKENVYAPISGIIDREFLSAGEMAAPGAPIVQILNTTKIKVVADIPERNLQSVKRGDQVEIYFPAIDKTINERISLVGRSIDPSNRTFKIEMNTSTIGGLLKPNLLAEVKFNDLSIKDAIVIPVDIIQENVNGEEYVYIGTPKDGKIIAEKLVIETDQSYDSQIVVTNGLKESDILIVKGHKSVKNGTELIINNSEK